MTQSSFTMPNLDTLTEATRLTKAGRLQEASALLQRGLSGVPNRSSARGTAESAPPHTIDLVATRPETAQEQRSQERRAHEPVSDAADAHAALMPEGVRDVVGQVLRGLRGGIAPVIKGFSGGLKGKSRYGRPPSAPQHGGQFVERSFSNAAGARDYKLFIPTNRAGNRPLIVMLHGCTQSPDDFAAGTRMNVLAEEQGAFVAYPGQTRGANMQKCWNWFEPGEQGRERGEAGIIAGIARAVIVEHDIDPSRVYIAGLSAGGAAAVNIARAYPDLFAAVGIHSGLAAGCARDMSSAMMAMRTGAPGAAMPGGPSGFGGGSATEALRLPTIVFHGDGDSTVNPRNAEEALAQAGIVGLQPRPETGGGKDMGKGPGRAYTRTRYADESGRTLAESWIVKDAGHAWSGGSPEGSYTDPQGPDASRAMLDFFAQHRLGALRA